MSDERVTYQIEFESLGDDEANALHAATRALNILHPEEAERVATYLATRYTAMRRAQEPF